MRKTTLLVFAATFAFSCAQANADTIIKLGFSTDPIADIELVANLLSTVDDGVGATTGDQNTELTFLGPLNGQPPIIGDNASFSLNGIMLDGLPTVIANTVIQETVSGSFELFDQNNALLLSGTLGSGILSGPIGGTATGGFLTAEFGNFNGGSLLPLLGNATQSSLSVSLTDVNNGAGFSTDQSGALLPFQADVTAIIGSSPAIPEPASIVLALMGVLVCLFVKRTAG